LNENGWGGAGAISEAKRERCTSHGVVSTLSPPRVADTNARDAEGVTGMEMEMEMEKNYT
jgi:hypothetical protein